jgi:hypothetical protein
MKSAAAAVGAQPSTRCDEGGQENQIGILSFHQGDTVDLHLVLCNAAFDIRVFLDDQLLIPPQSVNDELNVTLPPLAAGTHSLTWTYIAAGDSWKVRSEILVDGIVRFLMRKGTDSTMASNNVAVLLEVL